MPEDKELIRRALLGDPEAQKRCTEKEIVLPCPFCGNEYPAITSVQGYGIEIKCQHCNITFCRVSYSYGRAKELCRSVTLGAWNADQRHRLEGARIASGADNLLNKITSKSVEMFLAIRIRVCAIFLNQQTQDGKMTFAAILNQGRNNHDKILPIFKDERIRDTFFNVYGKRLRALE